MCMATFETPLVHMNEIFDYFICVLCTPRGYRCVESPREPEVVEVQHLSLDIPISRELLVVEKYMEINCIYSGFIP
jgi:hypothetical protein